ncbi:MAG: peptidylprolyl isomerase [Gammaproteobacteria bacterium]|nr:peptidylprolyl isomerase [Gammaproteobacteria bacterium]
MNFRERFFREPLVWFILVGALIFVVDRALSRDGAHEIVIDQGLRDRLSATWQASYGRAPSADEMRSLIEDHIVEEMLYREALALGLDHEDPIIRRRLTQKVRFLSEDALVGEVPTETMLRDWFEAREADYQEPARISFRHVYINSNAEPNADALTARLDGIEAALLSGIRADQQGDLFLLPLRYTNTSIRRVAGDFGDDFADTLRSLPGGTWVGPLASSHGLHFVFIEAQSKPLLPSFEQALSEVERDYQAAQREQANLDFIEGLRGKYRVIHDTEERAP